MKTFQPTRMISRKARMTTKTGAPLPRMTEAQETSSPTITACQIAGLGRTIEDRHGDHQHQREQGVRQDRGLEPDLPRVEQRRHGGQRRAPGRQPPAPQHRVDDRAERDAHQVLHRGHQQQAVERLEQVQHQRVPGRPELGQRQQLDALLHVGEGVLDEQRGLEAERGDHPRDDRKAGRDREQPVVAPQRGRRQRRPPRARARRGQRAGVEGDLRRPQPEPPLRRGDTTRRSRRPR